MKTISLILLIFALGVMLPAGPCSAQCTGNYDPPTGYYSSVDTSSSSALRSSLHAIIDDHTNWSYSTAWTILEEADENPGNTSNIIDVYKNADYTKSSHYPTWDREHTWPNSYGFPSSGDIPFTDCHQLRACDHIYNGARGNKPFDDTGGGTELSTDLNNGVGGGSGTYPGNSNWYLTDEFEVWYFRKGDVARSLLYMDVRYEGDTHDPTGQLEPDLVLTNNMSLIVPTEDSPAYMGRLETLIQWHLDDPVDDCERRRNDVVYSYQNNRNPFIDHPEWVCMIWTGETPCQSTPTPTSTWTSAPGTATPTPTSGIPGDGDPWINEIHYDNSGTDVNEGVEIAGPAGIDLSDYSLVLYNGSGETVYDTIPLHDTIPYQQECLGAVWFGIPEIQNGGPDGIALVDPSSDVIQFLSYEGSFTAIDGPATGMSSTDIGVEESSSTTISESLQLGGTGSEYADFSWQSALSSTHDAVNQNQTFSGGCTGETPTSTPTAGATGTPTPTSPPTNTFTPPPSTSTPTPTPTGGIPGSGEPWINEIHYDNDGGDTGEGVEIAGPAGLDLSGYTLVGYNGNGATMYDTVNLSGTLPDQEECLGTKWFEFLGLQNGSPDGIALVDPSDDVIQFLSYEGDFTASDGPAAGMTSTDIGVNEPGSTAIGDSLQLGGTGKEYSDFTWQNPLSATEDAVNQNQVFSGGCTGETPTASPTNVPTDTPTPVPSDTATPNPTNSPTPVPSDTPTSLPSDTPTAIPTNTPTGVPTDTPTPEASGTFTPEPTSTSTPESPPIPATGPAGILGLMVMVSLLLIVFRYGKQAE